MPATGICQELRFFDSIKLKERMLFDIGESHFKQIAESGRVFLDKSLVIAEIIKGKKIKLFLGPRRFGKSLTMSMINYFLNREEVDRVDLFENLAIWNAADGCYREHHGKYPVISINFADIRSVNYTEAKKWLSYCMSKLYVQYKQSLFKNLSEEDQTFYKAVLKRSDDEIVLKHSLKNLIQYLFNHYENKVVILIDEFDTPFHNSHLDHYYPEMFSLLQDYLDLALKDNPYIYQAVLTGGTFALKDSLFSKLSDFACYSIFSDEYSDFFGITEEEMHKLISQFKIGTQILHPDYCYTAYDIQHLLAAQLGNSCQILSAHYPFFDLAGCHNFQDSLVNVLKLDVPTAIPVNLIEKPTKRDDIAGQSMMQTHGHWIGLALLPTPDITRIILMDSRGNGLGVDCDIAAMTDEDWTNVLDESHPMNLYWKQMRQLTTLIQMAVPEEGKTLQIIVTGTCQQHNSSDGGPFTVQNLVQQLVHTRLSTVTGEELRQLHNRLDDLKKEELFANLKKYYGGYRSGTSPKTIYNPWSVIQFLNEYQYKPSYIQFKPYWLDTADNGFISRSLSSIPDAKIILKQLAANDIPIITCINEDVYLDEIQLELKSGNYSSLWSFMLLEGYLTVRSVIETSEGMPMYALTAPNQEILDFYKGIRFEKKDKRLQLSPFWEQKTPLSEASLKNEAQNAMKILVKEGDYATLEKLSVAMVEQNFGAIKEILLALSTQSYDSCDKPTLLQ